jgi:hypothetical protein
LVWFLGSFFFFLFFLFAGCCVLVLYLTIRTCFHACVSIRGSVVVGVVGFFFPPFSLEHLLAFIDDFFLPASSFFLLLHFEKMGFLFFLFFVRDCLRIGDIDELHDSCDGMDGEDGRWR